ncbi:MAG TPA: hypothetical protein PK425_11360 [Syntrophales bacterium]|nr:hypothetical protein [Syntrophales bacterium]
MQTVFSHIVQKRLSQENENVATEALAFVLRTHEAAHNGIMKLFRGIDPHMPRLWFRTQQTDANNRPDMQGCDEEGQTHVLVENKFWAGLTENQPVSYLRMLAEYAHPTILLVVGPEDRKEALWRELNQRLADEKISVTKYMVSGIFRITTTSIGPVLALTSWKALLAALEPEVAEDKSARSDLLQLRALCDAADSDAFVPISSAEVSDQRIPALILQLNPIVKTSVDLAVKEDLLTVNGLRPQASWERIGRYARFPSAGVWFGTHFDYWKKHGITPLWLLFSGDWGRALEVRSLLEPWASKEGVFTTFQNDELAVAIDIALGEDKDQVIRRVVDRLKGISELLKILKPKPKAKEPGLDDA